MNIALSLKSPNIELIIFLFIAFGVVLFIAFVIALVTFPGDVPSFVEPDSLARTDSPGKKERKKERDTRNQKRIFGDYLNIFLILTHMLFLGI